VHYTFNIDFDDSVDERMRQHVLDIMPAALEASLALGRVDREIMKLFVRHTPPTVDDVREAIRQAEIYREALGATPWMTAAQLREIAGFFGEGPPPDIERWKQQRKTFSIMYQDGEYFPRYAFGREYRPLRAVATIRKALPRYSGQQLAIWFEQPSPLLGGRRPRELLAWHPQRVVAAAKATAGT